MQHDTVAYFGYGSLVNRATHRTGIVAAVPARLIGWQRCWRPRADTSVLDAAILSVRRQAGAVTEGLLIFDRASNLPAIDERERHYARQALSVSDIEVDGDLPGDCPRHVYEVPHDPQRSFGGQRILRSYLDTVLQGFLVEHGEDAARRFVASTESFDIGILDDRTNPRYQRAVPLSAFERELFDSILAHLPSISR